MMLSRADAFHYSVWMGINAADYLGGTIWTIPAGLEANPFALTPYFWIYKLLILPLIIWMVLWAVRKERHAKIILFILVYPLSLLAALSNFQGFHGLLWLTIAVEGLLCLQLGIYLGRDYAGDATAVRLEA